jgi:hypothetical protein
VNLYPNPTAPLTPLYPKSSRQNLTCAAGGPTPTASSAAAAAGLSRPSPSAAVGLRSRRGRLANKRDEGSREIQSQTEAAIFAGRPYQREALRVLTVQQRLHGALRTTRFRLQGSVSPQHAGQLVGCQRLLRRDTRPAQSGTHRIVKVALVRHHTIFFHCLEGI